MRDLINFPNLYVHDNFCNDQYDPTEKFGMDEIYKLYLKCGGCMP